MTVEERTSALDYRYLCTGARRHIRAGQSFHPPSKETSSGGGEGASIRGKKRRRRTTVTQTDQIGCRIAPPKVNVNFRRLIDNSETAVASA